jgi:hypothetical protein
MYARLLHFVAISSHPVHVHFGNVSNCWTLYMWRKRGERSVGDECRVNCSHIGIN